jgi:hypothetical protein
VQPESKRRAWGGGVGIGAGGVVSATARGSGWIIERRFILLSLLRLSGKEVGAVAELPKAIVRHICG